MSSNNSNPTCHPLTLFHLVPLDAKTKYTAFTKNGRFASYTSQGERGLEVGYHVASSPSKNTIVRIGGEGDLRLQNTPRNRITRVHAAINFHPDTHLLLLQVRTKIPHSVTLQTTTVHPLTPVILEPRTEGYLFYTDTYIITVGAFSFKLVWRERSEIRIQLPQGVYDVIQALASQGYRNSQGADGAPALPVSQTNSQHGALGFVSYNATRVRTGRPVIDEVEEARSWIGGGACGKVYRGLEKLHKHPMAIKVVNLEIGNLRARVKAYREVEVIRQLGHPNIVRLLTFQKVETNLPEIFLEWVETDVENLAQRLGDANNKLELKQLAFKVILHGLQALDYLAHNKIIHRDIKPANLLCLELDPSHSAFVIKIADFGFAREAIDANTRCGTPLFLPPEFYYNPSIAFTPKWDIWSLLMSAAHIFPDANGSLPSFQQWGWMASYQLLQQAIKTPGLDGFEPMARLHPESRASAAQMLVHAGKLGGLTTPLAQVPPMTPDTSRQLLPMYSAMLGHQQSSLLSHESFSGSASTATLASALPSSQTESEWAESTRTGVSTPSAAPRSHHRMPESRRF